MANKGMKQRQCRECGKICYGKICIDCWTSNKNPLSKRYGQIRRRRQKNVKVTKIVSSFEEYEKSSKEK